MILSKCVAFILLILHAKHALSAQIIDDIYRELSPFTNGDKNEIYYKISRYIAHISDLEGLPNPILSSGLVYDLSLPCPNGWVPADDGASCIKGYFTQSSHCGSSIPLEASTPLEKIVMASSCGLEFSVLDSCLRDFAHPCPENWKIAGQFCIAPSSYAGKCVRLKNFYNLTPEQRQQWSYECDVTWPCLPVDYSTDCPENWKLSGNFCTADSGTMGYTGSCDLKVETRFLSTVADKAKFSASCNVHWPLKSRKNDSGVLYDNDFCPIGWNNDGNTPANCVAPTGYEGPCGNLLPTAKSSHEKLHLSKLCGVRWFQLDSLASKAGSELSDCPFGWTLNDNLCVAPPSYQGPCQVSVDMTNFTPEMKRIWGQACESQFLVHEPTVREKPINNYNYTAIARELEDLLNSTHDPLEKSTIQNEIQLANKEAERKLKLATGSRFIQLTNGPPCDFDLLECPYGWVRLDERRCLAPSTYRLTGGNCPDVIVPIAEARRRLQLKDFEGRNPAGYNQSNGESDDKLSGNALALACNIEFPCKTCIKDYVTSLCPVNWMYDAQTGLCSAPANYPQRLRLACGDKVAFKFATPLVRRQWEMACEAQFPCASSCSPNYSHPCPKGFSLKRILRRKMVNIAICKVSSPKSLSAGNIVKECLGPNKTISVLLTVSSKKMLARTCNVSWPCASRCVENFWQACPYGWSLVDDFCVSPKEYTPPKDCPIRISVDKISTPLAKLNFSLNCSAKWPCLDYCQQDFSKPCPLSWLEADGLCTAGVEHLTHEQGDTGCNSISKGCTFAERQEFAFRCRVNWPCGGSDTSPPNPNWQLPQVSDLNWENRNTIRYYAQL